MQAEAETIQKMSETLESANFNRDQSDAFIQSMALAMKTFAVTPELLDNRLAKQQESIDELKDTMHDLKRSLLNYLLGFTLATFAGLMGILAAVLAS